MDPATEPDQVSSPRESRGIEQSPTNEGLGRRPELRAPADASPFQVYYCLCCVMCERKPGANSLLLFQNETIPLPTDQLDIQ